MKISVGLTLLGIGLALGVSAQPAGHWQGKIQIPDHELGVTVDLAKNSKGTWIGSMSVTGLISIVVRLSNIIVDGVAVRFAANVF